MKKRIICMALLGLTMLVSAGCGKVEKDTEERVSVGEYSEESSFNTIAGDDNIIETVIHKEPPAMELHPVSGEGNSLLIRSCGYTWTWPEGPDLAGSAVADGPSPLSDGAHWETLILPESGDGSSAYTLTIEVEPDELGIHVWDVADIGNNDAPSEGVTVYQRAEIASADFSIPLQAGKVYEIYMEWNQENVDKNGCFGIAYYVFKTDLPMQEGTENASDGLTETVKEKSEFPEAALGETDTEEINVIDDVAMTVTNVTPEGASVEILNQSSRELTFGDDYELQAWQDGSWYQVDYIIDNWAFNGIGYETGTDRDKRTPLCLEVNWTYFHGILPAGRYRITKTALAKEADSLIEYRLAAEFEVE